jgi:hypothetical protein
VFRRRGWLLFPWLIGAVLCCCLSRADSSATKSDVLRFDKQWWNQASSDEQQGFIYGYRDCRQPAKAPLVSINDAQAFVSKILNSQKSTMSNAVTAAIHLSWKKMKSQAIPKNAEVFAGPHGFLDGEWWGGFSGAWPPKLVEADRGYLEGYLECASAPVTVQMVRRYQTAINQHYGSGRHDHDKIANVLQSLLKHASGVRN